MSNKFVITLSQGQAELAGQLSAFLYHICSIENQSGRFWPVGCTVTSIILVKSFFITTGQNEGLIKKGSMTATF